MFSQTSFLKEPNSPIRHYLQLKGFMFNSYLEIASDILGKELFKLPEIEVSIADMKRLDMPKYLRLGNRLERFFAFIIQESEGFEMLAQNIQIIENKVTLGELDFIVKNLKNNEIYHIELGGKLYLYDPNIEGELARWVGPNYTDSLLKKLDKLQTFQFPLLHHSFTRQVLTFLRIDPLLIFQKICLKVRLFLPLTLKGTIPLYVEAHNIKGYYLKMFEFLTPEYAAYQYFLPEKQDWIVEPKYGEVWYSQKDLIPMVEKMLSARQSPMVWVKKEETVYETIFVVFW
jgi:hypothetical protein